MPEKKLEPEKYPLYHCVVRYCHSPSTEEFVNIGVICLCLSPRFLSIAYHKRLDRVLQVFPDANIDLIKIHLDALTLWSDEAVLPQEGEGGEVSPLWNLLNTYGQMGESSIKYGLFGGGLSQDFETSMGDLLSLLVPSSDLIEHDSAKPVPCQFREQDLTIIVDASAFPWSQEARAMALKSSPEVAAIFAAYDARIVSLSAVVNRLCDQLALTERRQRLTLGLEAIPRRPEEVRAALGGVVIHGRTWSGKQYPQAAKE